MPAPPLVVSNLGFLKHRQNDVPKQPYCIRVPAPRCAGRPSLGWSTAHRDCSPCALQTQFSLSVWAQRAIQFDFAGKIVPICSYPVSYTHLFVIALKKVDFPTFGNPTIPSFICLSFAIAPQTILYSGQISAYLYQHIQKQALASCFAILFNLLPKLHLLQYLCPPHRPTHCTFRVPP